MHAIWQGGLYDGSDEGGEEDDVDFDVREALELRQSVRQGLADIAVRDRRGGGGGG